MLNTPPVLLGAALLFWGWQTGFGFAAIMALIIELSRRINARWEFSQTDYNRIWDLCAVLFLGVAVYSFASNEGAQSVAAMFDTAAKRNAAVLKTAHWIMILFQWLPVAFFPILTAQAYGSKEKIAFSTFSWMLRRRMKRARQVSEPRSGANIAFIYFGVCLFAASTGVSGSPEQVEFLRRWFYPVAGLLIAWALFTQRCKRFSVPVWGATLLGVALLGFGAQLGLKQVQRMLERLDSALMSRFARQGFDSANSVTSIGTIGRLNLSGRIVLRLQSDSQGFPDYLREASYNLFQSPTWHATLRNFSGVASETNETTWILLPRKESKHSIKIAQYLHNGRGLLALPPGASMIEQLPGAMETNRFGAVKMDAAPGFANYTARYDLGQTIDGAPNERDLEIPTAEDAALSEIADELGLKEGEEPREVLQKVAEFFQNHFEYSSYLSSELRGTTNETPLARFLLRKRSGHCEYFATATALLLRKAGIPTRYAVGYSVQESKGTKAVVRERHAHAWCLVHVNGIWQDFDTTPASWSASEAKHASFWEPLSDAWSRVWFEFSKWRYGQANFRRYVPWLFAPVLAVLLAQLLLRRRSRSAKAVQARSLEPRRPGLDSEFYEIERWLARRGLERHAYESCADWIRRIGSAIPNLVGTLPQILALHYRHRFDPLGLSESDRKQLAAHVAEWLRLQSVIQTGSNRAIQ